LTHDVIANNITIDHILSEGVGMQFRPSIQRVVLVAAACAGAAVLLTAGLPAATAAPAISKPLLHHAPQTGKFKVSYTRRWTWKSSKLHGFCVKFTATGYFTYKVTETFTTKRAELHWVNQVLNDPTFKVQIYRPNCRTARVVSKVDIAQHWKGYGCSFNPSISISASAPAGISVGISGWPSCGNKTQGIYGTNYGKGWHHTQYNTGSPMSFGEYTDGLTGVGLVNPPPCYGVYPSAIVYADGNSNSYGAANLHKSAQVCLSKYQ
jgi:hypothetical protein